MTKGVGSGGAEVLNPRDGFIVQAQRITERDSGLAVALRRGVGSEPSRIDLFRGNLGIIEGCERRLYRHLFIALVKVVTEFNTPDSNDRNLILQRVGHGSLLYG